MTVSSATHGVTAALGAHLLVSDSAAVLRPPQEKPMNRTELEQLPPLVDLPTAARVLGIGRTLAYELVKADRWPTTVLRVGKLIRIPTAALLRLVDDTAP